MFWAYGPFSQLESLSASSFVKLGYDVVIWTYGDLPNAPPGATVADARSIFPEDRVFTYKNGSYAAFSNLFRYAVLHREGGLYVDTDVIALRPPEALPKHPFLVAERSDFPMKRWKRRLRRTLSGRAPFILNPNVIFNPTPQPGNIVDLALAVSERYPPDAMEWGDIGPTLLTALHKALSRVTFEVMPPDFANGIDWWECPAPLLAPGGCIPPQATFLHCFNEMWRRGGVDKNAPYPAGSMMEQLAARFM